ncbi:hypothetical protein PDY_06040 [Photobacterium damselae subsp. damselae]|uniref:hypothetical protein n=1 Tax=Photobacterium damselae TaxID=38293 RepID=UPI002205549B|nr:hypothetical protein [Photobacterium damselae]BDR33556.1 hypothetical protein PDY_06040 [Photobacterium damselae subsp. damselae]
MTKNIDDFNEIAAKLFYVLQDKFPVRTLIDEVAFFGYEPIKFHPVAGRTLTDKQEYEFKMLSETIIWLSESGFIRCNDYPHEKSNVVLTEKGLELLKLKPDTLNSNTVGDTIVNLIKKGSESSLGAVFSTALTLAFGV